MRFRIVLLLCACSLLGAAPAPPPVTFFPTSPRFAPAADEYRSLWETEAPRIVAAMEEVTGIAFPETPIDVIVSEAAPMTAFDGRSMRLRASYSLAYKRATLVHEMGHRVAFTLPRTPDTDDHRLLYLFLYDVWTDLYGQDFADRMVRIERRIRGSYDYDAAWTWALAMNREERQARLRGIRPRLDYDFTALGRQSADEAPHTHAAAAQRR